MIYYHQWFKHFPLYIAEFILFNRLWNIMKASKGIRWVDWMVITFYRHFSHVFMVIKQMQFHVNQYLPFYEQWKLFHRTHVLSVSLYYLTLTLTSFPLYLCSVIFILYFDTLSILKRYYFQRCCRIIDKFHCIAINLLRWKSI